jgi:hypothetical protein
VVAIVVLVINILVLGDVVVFGVELGHRSGAVDA